jgi:hypothetical protein
VIEQLAWALAATASSGLAWDFGRRWLQRNTRIEERLAHLERELEGTHNDGAKHFENVNARFFAIESMMKQLSHNAFTPARPNPLGRDYKG